MYTGRRTCDTCSECSPITSRHSWIWCTTCNAHTGVAAHDISVSSSNYSNVSGFVWYTSSIKIPLQAQVIRVKISWVQGVLNPSLFVLSISLGKVHWGSSLHLYGNVESKLPHSHTLNKWQAQGMSKACWGTQGNKLFLKQNDPLKILDDILHQAVRPGKFTACANFWGTSKCNCDNSLCHWD